MLFRSVHFRRADCVDSRGSCHAHVLEGGEQTFPPACNAVLSDGHAGAFCLRVRACLEK